MKTVKMPSNCVACTVEETEYDGCGFDWQKFGEIAGIVASCAMMITSGALMFKKGFTGNGLSMATTNGPMNKFGGAMLGVMFVGAGGVVASVGCLAAHEMDKL